MLTDPNVERVREFLLTRSFRGIQKYGTTTERSDLAYPQWLRHLQEELCDAVIYIEAALSRLSSSTSCSDAMNSLRCCG